ncbi:MAG: fused MFS/spermidine synthase [Verrucomicrobiae bacterium]|nr:fused MFS/spermidine synthase [Verrucomicrobiae bacterium]
MHLMAAIGLAFLSGMAVMVIEIVGARMLARDFGGSFYVWTSQIGVVLVALAIGYVVGGVLADRYRRPRLLAWVLGAAGVFTVAIPWFAGDVMGYLVDRHPHDQDIPALWQRLDPALGAAVVFLPPCLLLAILPPYLIRLATGAVDRVGRVSGWVYGAGSAGSIVGVFASGYILIDLFPLPWLFLGTGGLILALAVLCWFWNLRSHEDDP